MSVALVIVMDLMMGLNLSMSLRNLANPFRVMTIPEYAIFVVLLSAVFIPPVVSYLKQKETGQNR